MVLEPWIEFGDSVRRQGTLTAQWRQTTVSLRHIFQGNNVPAEGVGRRNRDRFGEDSIRAGSQEVRSICAPLPGCESANRYRQNLFPARDLDPLRLKPQL